jgi:Ca-activated chloride channel family protein
MDDHELKQLFDSEKIPEADDNSRKVNLNLATAEFEKMQKNANNSQGNVFLSRLIFRQPNTRREKMSFSKKKVVYGGLATACVALMVFGIAPSVMDAHRGPSDFAGADFKQLKEEVGSLEQDKASVSAGATIASNQITNGKSDMKVTDSAVAPAESVSSAPMEAAKRMASPSLAPAAPMAMTTNMVMGGMAADSIAPVQQEFGRDKFKNVDENNVHQVAVDPISTFSIDVDTAAYSYMRSSLNQGVLPQKDSVRVEELVNYFDYAYPLPTDKAVPFSTNVVLKPSPWGEGKQLMTIGIKGYDIPKTQMPNSNLVFLLDTSGSMAEPNKLPLLKQSISMLLDTLKPTDTISIVVYAGSAGTVLQPTKVSDKGAILMALQNLEAGGGTAGAEGIRQAYQLAETNFDKNAVNRVILGTDGDFNVGITNPEELKDFVEREKDKGIFLSVLGFGRGNYNDEMMQTLAQNGNGTAAYIDSINEARKVLVEEATSTLFPIAKDVKIQVEFNPATVAEYRLVGYETRALKTEDFNNDKVDAGDIGAGAEVTAIYEVTPKGGKTAVDESRYAPKADEKKAATDELAFVKLRYKLPNETESKLITTPITAGKASPSAIVESETNWAVAVASFAQIIKGGAYTGKMTYDDVLKLAEANKGSDPFGYRAEFITLIHKAKTAAGMQAQPSGGQAGSEGGVVYPYPVPVAR